MGQATGKCGRSCMSQNVNIIKPQTFNYFCLSGVNTSAGREKKSISLQELPSFSLQKVIHFASFQF